MKLLETIDYCINLAEDELANLEVASNTYKDSENPPHWIADWKVEAEGIREHLKNLEVIRSSYRTQSFPTPIIPDETIEMFKTYAPPQVDMDQECKEALYENLWELYD
jgi:hypothetical protein